MTETPSPGSSSPGDAGSIGDVAAWQQTLAAEHAVIWSYGLVGATDGLADAAEAALAVHRSRRATCLEAITALGADAVSAAPAYAVAKPPSTAAGRRLAAELEQSASVAYLTLAGSDDRATRLLAARWLRESAVAQVRWGGAVPALPGYQTD